MPSQRLKGDSDMNAQPHTDPAQAASPAPLCPIPRNGIKALPGVLLIALLTVASAAVCLGQFAGVPAQTAAERLPEYISVGVIILLVLYLWRVTRTTAKTILPILIFAGAAVYYFTSSITLTAALCGLLFAIGEGSFLLAVLPRKMLAWFPIIPILAYAAALALARDPIASATVLIPFPAMIVLALGTRHSAEKQDGLTRVGVICATSLTLGLTLLAITALLLYRDLGTLAPDALLDELEALRAALINDITSAEIPEGFDPEMVAELEKLLTYASAENMVNSVFNLLPALFVVTVNLISAAVQVLQHATLRTFGYGDSVSDRVRTFSMSLISCIVFLAAYLVTFLGSTEVSSLAGTVAQNIYIIFMPGLALAGMLRLMGMLVRKGPGGMGCLFYLALLIPCLLLFAPFVLAAVEVIGHIFTAITSAIGPDKNDDDPFSQS